MKRIILILYLMLLIAGGNFVRAEDPPASNKPDELRMLIEEALKNNPEIKTAHEQWKAAQKRVPQASSLPDPMAGYTYMGATPDTLNGPEMERYEFEQMVPFPGKLFGRRNAAKAEAATIEAKMQAVEREIIFKVSEAYYDLVTTQKNIALVGEIKSALKQSQAALQARYSTSEVMQSELL